MTVTSKAIELMNDKIELNKIKRSKSIPVKPRKKRATSPVVERNAYNYALDYPINDIDLTHAFFTSTVDMPCCIQRFGHEDQELGFPPVILEPSDSIGDTHWISSECPF